MVAHEIVDYPFGSVATRDCDGVMSLSDPLLRGERTETRAQARARVCELGRSGPLSTAQCDASTYRFPVLAGILNAVEGVLDWLPQIAVSSMSGSYSPAVALSAGTSAAAFVLLLQRLKQQFYDPRTIFPKVLDLGQFGLFGLLWVFSLDRTKFYFTAQHELMNL